MLPVVHHKVFGAYTCIAENTHGRLEKVIYEEYTTRVSILYHDLNWANFPWDLYNSQVAMNTTSILYVKSQRTSDGKMDIFQQNFLPI